jgi:hypothetical protein
MGSRMPSWASMLESCVLDVHIPMPLPPLRAAAPSMLCGIPSWPPADKQADMHAHTHAQHTQQVHGNAAARCASAEALVQIVLRYVCMARETHPKTLLLDRG